MEGIMYVAVLVFIAIASGVDMREKREAPPLGNVMLTDRQRMDILQTHNDFRRASGSSNMLYMTWDSKLAWIAEEYGKKCKSGHNGDRKAQYGKSSVGENIWKSSGKVNGSKAVGAIGAWHNNEIANFVYSSHTCKTGIVCGHYTQVVWSSTYKVGCGMTVCSDGTSFICNYAPAGNIVYNGKYGNVFKKGTACSECEEGDYCRDGLCANSMRDFIDEPQKPATERTEGLTRAVVILTLIVVALLAFIIYKERDKLPAKLKFWEKIPRRQVPASGPASS